MQKCDEFGGRFFKYIKKIQNYYRTNFLKNCWSGISQCKYCGNNLNATGKEIWQGIESGLDVGQIVEKMVETYEVEPDKAREDIQTMVDKMKNAGIIVE